MKIGVLALIVVSGFTVVYEITVFVFSSPLINRGVGVMRD
jgi:hypothetical protein